MNAQSPTGRDLMQRATLITYGDRIRHARMARGLTQEDLAAAMGVTRSAVAQWETDRNRVTPRLLPRLHAVLDVRSIASPDAMSNTKRARRLRAAFETVRIYLESYQPTDTVDSVLADLKRARDSWGSLTFEERDGLARKRENPL